MPIADAKPPLLFSLCAVGVGAAVAAGGWLTDARLVMHGALLFLGAVAFLPFALVAIGLLIGLLCAVAAGFSAATGEAADVSELARAGGDLAYAGAEGAVPYYRRVFQMKHPLIWGALAGLVAGAVVLWALLALLVVPGERETARLLAAEKARIERVYRTESRFPKPSDDRLVREDGEVVSDAFGRPLRYDVSGVWKLSSYKVVSLGYDGKPSSDDLCVSGSTKALEWAKDIQEAVALLEGDASTSDAFAGIRALRCE